MRDLTTIVERLRDLAQARPKHLRIHLGVHKTATTHLQAVLMALSPECASRAVGVLTPETIRSGDLMEELLRDGRRFDLSAVKRRLARRAALRRHGALCETLIVSEENIPGDAGGLLVDPIYPSLKGRTRNLQALADTADTEIFLSIRGWDDILPSAYATLLRTEAIPGGFSSCRRAALASPPCWVSFVDRVAACFPTARLRLWRQEDYRANALTVLNAIVGGWLTRLPEITDPLLTKTPSAHAIAMAEEVPAELVKHERIARIDAIYQDDLRIADAKKFMPFTLEERVHLRATYDTQVAQLRETWREAFLV